MFIKFKNTLSQDCEVQNQFNMIERTLRNDPSRAGNIHRDVMNQTFEYAVDTYTMIKEQHFPDMRKYLLGRIWAARQNIYK